MDIDHQLVFGRFAHGFVQPPRPGLRADLDKPVLDAAHAPLAIQRQDFVQLPLQGSAVDIQDNPDAALAGITDHVGQVERARRTLRIDVHLPSVGGVRVFVAVPAGIEFDVLQLAAHGKVDTRLPAGRRQGHFPDHLARLDPGRVGDRTRVVQVQDQIITFQQLSGAVGDHQHTPRGGVRRGDRRAAGQHAGDRVRPPGDGPQPHAGKIHQPGLGHRDARTAGDLDGQRPFAIRLDLVQTDHLIHALGGIDRVTAVVVRKTKFAMLRGDHQVAQRRLLRDRIAKGDPFVVGPEGQSQPPRRLLAVLQIHVQLFVPIANRAPLAVHRLPCRVVAGAGRVDQPQVSIQRRGVLQFQAQPAIGQQWPAAKQDAVGGPSRGRPVRLLRRTARPVGRRARPVP